MPDSARALTVGPGEGELLPTAIGGDVTFLARGEQTGGALSAFMVAVPPGEGPPLHVHVRQDEAIQVLEGEVRWKLGDELRATPAGSFVFIPRGTRHCFQNVGSTPARMLIAFMPAGMEGFFEAQAELTEFDLDTFRRAASAEGMEVVGPPLGESDPL